MPQSNPPCFSASAVSGMLSNTAEMKPRPKAECQEAGGSVSTGIIEAQLTRDSRKIEPLVASGNNSQSGRRSGTLSRSAIHTVAPMNGKRSEISLYSTLTITLVTMAQTRISATMPTRGQSMRMWLCSCLMMGEYLCCCRAAAIPHTTSATAAAT